jgi:hypothetical protein
VISDLPSTRRVGCRIRLAPKGGKASGRSRFSSSLLLPVLSLERSGLGWSIRAVLAQTDQGNRFGAMKDRGSLPVPEAPGLCPQPFGLFSNGDQKHGLADFISAGAEIRSPDDLDIRSELAKGVEMPDR